MDEILKEKINVEFNSSDSDYVKVNSIEYQRMQEELEYYKATMKIIKCELENVVVMTAEETNIKQIIGELENEIGKEI